MAKTTEPETAPREYVVLTRVEDEKLRLVGTFVATGAERAIDEARDGVGGRWVAVALSRWNELDLEVVQRDPTVKRTRIHPGQQTLDEAPTEVVAA